MELMEPNTDGNEADRSRRQGIADSRIDAYQQCERVARVRVELRDGRQLIWSHQQFQDGKRLGLTIPVDNKTIE